MSVFHKYHTRFVDLMIFSFLKLNYKHDLYVRLHLDPALSLGVLQNLFIKPALSELLTLVHQLEQSQVFLRVNVARQYVLLHAHLC